jgi:uncharacterized OB-fold protein
MAVTVGIEALGQASPQSVVLITRQPALLEGGNAAVLCAGLGIPDSTEVVERLGGAAALLDALTSAAPNTLVIGVDVDYVNGAGAGAILVGSDAAISFVYRVQRSLPTRTRHIDGSVYNDDEPRLTRERGIKQAFNQAKLATKPLLMTGVSLKNARAFCALPEIEDSLELPTEGASSPVFALALLSDNQLRGNCAGFDQANLSVVSLNASAQVSRFEPAAQPLAKTRYNEGPDVKIALPAYDRAFDQKLRLQAGRCNQCGTLSTPVRYRCISCGSENNTTLTPLPRNAEVYTTATIHVPVTGLRSPYTLVMAQLDDVDVRMLVTLTNTPPNSVAIGDKGRLVFRRVLMRSGVPDYGYAFSPLALEKKLTEEGS